MKNKKQVNEITGASKFVEKFFDGIVQNTSRRFIERAASKGVDTEIINKMRDIEKSNQELKNIISKYSK